MTTASVPRPPGARGGWRARLELAKPRITALVALCAAAGFALASTAPIDWARLGWTLLGVALASAATGCLNQVLEIGPDGLMERTKLRPLPSGRVSAAEAAALGLAWGAAGLAVLAWKTNAAACGLTAFTLASYLLVYTPMKRLSPLSTWAGAVPGALPPVIGWAAAGAPLDARAWALFALQFLWQMPHFLALAWLHRRDYARGGFRVYPVVEPGGASTAWTMASCAGLLAVLPAVFPALGLAPAWSAAALLAAGLWFFAVSRAAARELTAVSARRVFLASLAYLPAALALLVAGRP